jgi:hypothetical protein
MSNQKPGLLNSWKEIASYLGRGVRTVQRWEKMGLPVRRLGTGCRAPVIANVTDIDNWIQSVRTHGYTMLSPIDPAFCRQELRNSILQSRMLIREMISLRQTQRNSLTALVNNIETLQKACGTYSAEVIPRAVESEQRSRVQARALAA